MEYLSIKMESKTASEKIKPINDTMPSLTHLIYVDDVLIFMKAGIIGAKAIKKKIFQKLENLVWLQINNEMKRQKLCSIKIVKIKKILTCCPLMKVNF